MTSKELWPSSINLTKLLMLIPTVQKPVFPKEEAPYLSPRTKSNLK